MAGMCIWGVVCMCLCGCGICVDIATMCVEYFPPYKCVAVMSVAWSPYCESAVHTLSHYWPHLLLRVWW